MLRLKPRSGSNESEDSQSDVNFSWPGPSYHSLPSQGRTKVVQWPVDVQFELCIEFAADEPEPECISVDVAAAFDDSAVGANLGKRRVTFEPHNWTDQIGSFVMSEKRRSLLSSDGRARH
jgi:hypothetical protein